MKRTTVSADPNDLATLQAEARRRGVSLSQILREVVAGEADRLRRALRPRFGVARSVEGAAGSAGRDERAPLRERHGT